MTRGPWFGAGWGGWRVHAGISGGLTTWGACGMSVWVLSVYSKHPAGPDNKEETHGWVRGPRMWAGAPDTQRSLVSTWNIHKCACACESGECCVCTATAASCLCQLKRRGDSVVYAYVSSEAWTQVLLKAAPCVLHPVCPACVCLWDICWAWLLIESAKREVAAVFLSLSRDPGSQVNVAGFQWLAGGSPGLALLEPDSCPSA